MVSGFSAWYSRIIWMLTLLIVHLSNLLFHLSISSKLANNPYVCNCSMHWFIRKLRLKDYTQKIFDLKKMKCHAPAKMRGKLIYKLKEADVCPEQSTNCSNKCFTLQMQRFQCFWFFYNFSNRYKRMQTSNWWMPSACRLSRPICRL